MPTYSEFKGKISQITVRSIMTAWADLKVCSIIKKSIITRLQTHTIRKSDRMSLTPLPSLCQHAEHD